MSINIGSGGVYDVMVGSDEAQAVYLGSTKVWPFSPITETNTNRTNYSVPSGATGCYVTLIGGGGGGGGTQGQTLLDMGGAGGGGGAAVIPRFFIDASSLGSTYSVSRGLGGSSASDGANSVFSSGSITLTAGGGKKGTSVSKSNAGGNGGAAGTASVSGLGGVTTHNGTAGGKGGAYNAATPAAANNTSGGAPGGGGGAGRNLFGLYAGAKGGDSVYANGGAGGPNTANQNNPGQSGGSGGAGRPGGGGGGGGGSYGGPSYNPPGGSGGAYGAGGGGAGGGDAASVLGGSGADGYTRIEWVGQTHPAVKPGPPPPVPVFDAIGTGGNTTSIGASSLVVNGTHNCTGNALIVAVSVSSLGSITGATVTYNGVSMTQLGVGYMNGSTAMPVGLYGLLSPASGSHPIVVSITGTTLLTACMTSVSYSGVSSWGSATTTYGSSAAPSQTVNSSSSALITQAFGSATTSITHTGYTQNNRLEQSGTYANLIQGDAAGSASVDFDVTLSASNSWAGVAVELFS